MKKLLALALLLFVTACASVTQPQSESQSASLSGIWHETGSAWFKNSQNDSTWTMNVLPTEDSVQFIFISRANVYGDGSGSLWAPVISSDSIYATAGGNNSDYLALGLHGDTLVGTASGISVSFGR